MAREKTDHIPTVGELDLYRFEGTWFEIARLPLPIAKDWVGTTDTYERRGSGRYRVLYEGRKGTLDGPPKRLTQRLRIPDPTAPGEMKASFFPFVWLPYRLIHMDTDYRFMLVTSSSMNLLWIMSREPIPPEHEYRRLVETADRFGFDTARLFRVPQRSGEATSEAEEGLPT